MAQVSNTAKQFEAALKRIAKGIEQGAENYTARVALRTRDVVADRTPIDTGRASGSWNLAAGTPDTSTLPENFNQSRDASIALNAPLLGRIDINGFRLGVPFFVSDHVPYIGFLENGSSRQAPNGMVGVTLAQMASEVGSIPFRITEG